jgi:hypothetical protein
MNCTDSAAPDPAQLLDGLVVALAQWAARDDTKPDPEARRAANTAMTAIDALLGQLHALRAGLVSEIRASDDAAAARADATLEVAKAARKDG